MKKKYGTFTQWSITQPLRKEHHEVCRQMDGTREKIILSEASETQKDNSGVCLRICGY